MEIQEPPNKKDEKEVVVEEEKHHSPPVQALDITLPPPWPPPREKARSYMDQNHKPHPHIRFGPGKSRNRWPNPFEFFRRLYIFTICFLTNNGERKELNGLDMGWIKYKPPD
jgi:hypothetical protein